MNSDLVCLWNSSYQSAKTKKKKQKKQKQKKIITLACKSHLFIKTFSSSEKLEISLSESSEKISRSSVNNFVLLFFYSENLRWFFFCNNWFFRYFSLHTVFTIKFFYHDAAEFFSKIHYIFIKYFFIFHQKRYILFYQKLFYMYSF